MSGYVFAWLPVPLSVFDGKQWERTNRRAWLRRVRRILTVWGDIIYAEAP